MDLLRIPSAGDQVLSDKRLTGVGNGKPEEVRYRAWFDSDTSRRISKSKTGQRSSMQPDRCHPPPNQCHRRRTGNSCFRASGFCAECPGCRARRGVLDGRIRLTFQTGAENTDERRAIGKLDANRDSRPPPSFCSASALFDSNRLASMRCYLSRCHHAWTV